MLNDYKELAQRFIASWLGDKTGYLQVWMICEISKDEKKNWLLVTRVQLQPIIYQSEWT